MFLRDVIDPNAKATDEGGSNLSETTQRVTTTRGKDRDRIRRLKSTPNPRVTIHTTPNSKHAPKDAPASFSVSRDRANGKKGLHPVSMELSKTKEYTKKAAIRKKSVSPMRDKVYTHRALQRISFACSISFRAFIVTPYVRPRLKKAYLTQPESENATQNHSSSQGNTNGIEAIVA